MLVLNQNDPSIRQPTLADTIAGMNTGLTFQVTGVRPDGTQEVCAAGLRHGIAESAASTLRAMKDRGNTEVLVVQEADNDSQYAKS